MELTKETTVKEVAILKPLFPIFILMVITVLGLLALFHGVDLYLLYVAGGLLVGLPMLDMDKVLSKYLGTKENFFHSFPVNLLLFVMAIFIITGSSSSFGKGLILSMLLHSTLAQTEQKDLRISAGLLGLAIILLLFF